MVDSTYWASSSSKPSIEFRNEHSSVVEGIIVDTIQSLGPSATNLLRSMDVLRKWAARSLELVETYNSTSVWPIPEEWVWKTFIGNRVFHAGFNDNDFIAPDETYATAYGLV